MRTLYIFMLSLTAMVARAQSAEPFNGANKIIFECKDSAESLYIRLGKHLISKGYTITGDKDFLNIKTRSRGVSKFAGYTYTINSVIDGNLIMFTMDLTDMDDGTWQTISWEYPMTMLGGRSVYEHFLRCMNGFERTNVYYDKY